MAPADGDLDKAALQYCKANPKARLVECDGHKLMVVTTSSGKGYSPYALLAEGKFEEAARVAASAFNRNL